jgi:glycosyltransferase involved in cell wall biosynthesis
MPRMDALSSLASSHFVRQEILDIVLMRIAFVDITRWDYNVDSPYQRPLGGSQSALCYLAEALSERGHQVSLFNSTSQVSVVRGVTCAPAARVSAATWKEQDVVVVQNFADSAADLRPLLRADAKVALWTQHAHDQPAMKGLLDASLRDSHHAFVFVSEWQRRQFQEMFKVDLHKSAILRNAVSPVFENLFRPDESILGGKESPPVLAYTSTPFRGLNILLATFPFIRAAHPDVLLRVFSSMQVYQMAADKDAAQYGVLYERCRSTTGAEYVGSVPQPQLVKELRRTTLLTYPNHFAETSCISVMEAMAAGCHVVTSELGALPETAAGHATLLPVGKDWQDYGQRFVHETVKVLDQYQTAPDIVESRLRRQVDVINATCTWRHRALQWEYWLKTLCAA